MRSYLSGRRINIYEFLKLSRACDIVKNNNAKISLFVMFSICFLFLFSPFYVYFFIFCGLTHHPPPATRHPLPATRLPATRHPSPVTRGKVLPPGRNTTFCWNMGVARCVPTQGDEHCYVVVVGFS